MVRAAQVSGSGEIYVTSVLKSAAGAVRTYGIVLNDSIQVKDIRIDKADGRTTLKYPVYISRGGKEYPQFEILTRQAKEEIEKAVLSDKSSSKSSKQMSFKISDFSPLSGESSRKVNACVDFNDAVRIYCGVMESGRGPWISWPSVKNESGGKWLKQIVITNRSLRYAVEKALVDKYSEYNAESSEEK